MLNKVNLFVVDRSIIFALFLILPILSVLGFSGKYTVISILFILVFLYYAKSKSIKKITVSFPLLVWLALTIYHWVNAMNKEVPEVDYYDLLHGIKIYLCIVIFAYLARKNLNETIKSLVICFSIYLLMSFFINDTSSEKFNGRMTGVVFATQLGQIAALSGVYISYYSLLKKLSIFKTVLLYLLPILVIILTQSRNSLAMIAIGIIGFAIAYMIKQGKNLSRIIALVSVISILSFFLVNILLTKTEIGKRITNTEVVKQSQELNGISTGTNFDAVVGDRLIYYVLGWKYFIDSPITGIGMWNFEYVSKGNFPLHSEFMIHLSEGGLIGLSLWLLFLVLIFYGIFKSNYPTYIKIIAFFSILEILFCGIYARVFYYEFFYPIIGIAIAISSKGLISKTR
jgi:O-antigen ligase